MAIDSGVLAAAEQDFCNVIAGDFDHIIEIAYANAGTSRFNRAIYLNQIDELEIKKLCQQRRNVSFAAGFSKDLLMPLDFGQEMNRKGTDNFVKAKKIISFDIDFKDNDIRNEQEFASIETLSAQILQSLHVQAIRPWLLVFSGHGIHMHFKLSQYSLITSIQRYKQIYESCLGYLECITGLKFDFACSNPSRLMRVPFSTNWKDLNNPIPCQILHHDAGADFSWLWDNFHKVIDSTTSKHHGSTKDRGAILANLDLQKILDHFGYEKHDSIKKRSQQIVCSSPFSKDSNPSFFYDSLKKVFFDFSQGSGGDLFHLIALFMNLNTKTDFLKVLECAAVIAGIENQVKTGSAFNVDKQGVWYQPSQNSDPLWLSSPIYVTALTRDMHGQSWGRLLTIKDQDDEVKNWSMPMELLAGDGSEVRKNILRLGAQLAVGNKERQLFLSYLQTSCPERRVRCVNRIGWHQGNYVLPDEVIVPEKESNQLTLQIPVQEPVFGKFGSLNDWQQSVGAFCLGNSRLIFAVSASLASVLLKMTGGESGGFHFVGPSSIGKSITLKVAASVWGNPGLNGFIKRWRSTINGLELLAAARCDSLLILDELGEISIKDAAHAAYMLSGGVSKNRATKATKLADSFEWRLIFLSSGEVTLESQGGQDGVQIHAGQEIRFIDLPAEAANSQGIFENIHGHESSGLFASKLSENSEKYYGTAIRHFLRKLIDDSNTSRKIEALQQEFIAQNNGALPGQIYRALKRFALVASAGEFAIEIGTLPWQKGDALWAAQKLFREWRENWSNIGTRESRKFLNQTRLLLQEYGPSRFPILSEFKNSPNSYQQHLWGFRKETSEGYDWIILSEIFRNQFCKGFSPKLGLRTLQSLDFLQSSSAPMRVPHLGVTRVVSISGKIIS